MTAVARYLRGLFFLAMIMFVCFHDSSMHLLAERLRFRLRVQLLGIHPPATHTPVFAWQFLLCAVRVPSRLLVCRQSLGKVRRGPRQDMKPKIAELHRVHTKKREKKKRHAMSHDSIWEECTHTWPPDQHAQTSSGDDAAVHYQPPSFHNRALYIFRLSPFLTYLSHLSLTATDTLSSLLL